MESTLEAKLFYSYNDKYGDGIRQEHLDNHPESIIFDHHNRALYTQGHEYGNHFRGSYHGEVFNDFVGNKPTGIYSHAEGSNTSASGHYSHAEGFSSSAFNNAAHAEGYKTWAQGENSHSEGYYTTALGSFTHAEGYKTFSGGGASHTEGYYTVTNGLGAHAEGSYTKAQYEGSHAEGISSYALSAYSHAEGYYTKANGDGAHSGGAYTMASGANSVAIGTRTFVQANGTNSVALGNKSEAKGSNSFVGGDRSTGYSDDSFVFAVNSAAYTTGSVLFGKNNETRNTNEVAFGINNKSIASSTTTLGTLFTVGNGTPDNKGNAFAIDEANNAYIANDVYVKSFDGSGIKSLGSYTFSAYATVQRDFVTHEQLVNNGEKIDKAYVSSLGKDANLNVVMQALLTKPEYKTPTCSFSLSDGTTTYGSVVNGDGDPSGNVVEVGTTMDLFATIDMSYYKNGHNTNGMSYGFSKCTFNLKGNEINFNSLGKHDIGDFYIFGSEGTHNIIDSPINFTYLHSSYQGYPQLLESDIYVPSKEKWFNNSKPQMDKYKIVAKFLYYYGWDKSLDEINPLTNGTPIWMPIVNKGSNIVSNNINFTSGHTSFWYAYPADVVDPVKTSGFDILYHTAIGDADLVSASTTITEKEVIVKVNNMLVDDGRHLQDEIERLYITENIDNLYNKRYIVVRVDFNKTISGANGNYVKFSLNKKI